MTATSIAMEIYLRKEVWKGSKQHSDNRQNKPYRFAKKKDKHLNKIEMERKDSEHNVIRPTKNMDTIHNDRQAQSTANKTLNKTELCRQMQNQENLIMTRLGQISRKLVRLCYFQNTMTLSSWNIYIRHKVSVMNRHNYINQANLPQHIINQSMHR